MTAVALSSIRPQARAPTAAVSISGLTKSFLVSRPWSSALRAPLGRDRRCALASVSLDIREGEFFGVLGPNGAGKTTLFKILSTLILPDAGTATVLKHDVVRDATLTRRVLAPVIADERSLHWRLSAIENLRLFAALHAVPRSDVGREVNDLLGLVGLDGTGAQQVGTFSSGMKQRLLIARALLARPRVLLLDEPTRSLDPVSARALRAFLREELVGRRGCTVILATHTAEEAFDLCDRVAILHQGRVLAVGAASALARDVGDARYHVWTRNAHHPAWQTIVDRGMRMVEAPPLIDGGWTRVVIDVPGGLEQAASTLDLLTCAGVPIARFEQAPLALAELLERVVRRTETPHA